jgi:hypothetical protein
MLCERLRGEPISNRVEVISFHRRGDRKSPEGARVPRHMLAVLEAESADDAEAHVKENLPDGVYDIGPAEPRQSGSA